MRSLGLTPFRQNTNASRKSATPDDLRATKEQQADGCCIERVRTQIEHLTHGIGGGNRVPLRGASFERFGSTVNTASSNTGGSFQKEQSRSGGSQRKQLNPTVQPANDGNCMKLQRALSLLQLLIGETIRLFIAGIAIPSFLRSAVGTNQTLATCSLYARTIACEGDVIINQTPLHLAMMRVMSPCCS
jgi:hypothetical protein